MTVKATIRTDASAAEAIDSRVVAEVNTINAAFDNATKALEPDTKALPAPIQIATFEA